MWQCRRYTHAHREWHALRSHKYIKHKTILHYTCISLHLQMHPHRHNDKRHMSLHIAAAQLVRLMLLWDYKILACVLGTILYYTWSGMHGISNGNWCGRRAYSQFFPFASRIAFVILVFLLLLALNLWHRNDGTCEGCIASIHAMHPRNQSESIIFPSADKCHDFRRYVYYGEVVILRHHTHTHTTNGHGNNRKLSRKVSTLPKMWMENMLDEISNMHHRHKNAI